MLFDRNVSGRSMRGSGSRMSSPLRTPNSGSGWRGADAFVGFDDDGSGGSRMGGSLVKSIWICSRLPGAKLKSIW